MRGTEFAELAALAAVVEEKSFRRAAQRLNMSPSALSHTIRTLEERLGARLLNRTTRSVATTEAGQTLFNRLRPAIGEIENAVRDVGAFQQEPRGVVRVNMPRIAARLIVAPKLADFRARFPGVRLDIVIDDSIIDIVAKGFDAGIRSGSLVQQDMISVKLTQDLRMAVVGSPTYFQGRSLPQVPSELHDHACITYRWYETGALYRWHFDGPDGAVNVDIESVLTGNDTDLLLTAALQSCGLAFLPESLVSSHITSGALVRALDAWCKPFPGFYLYYLSNPQMPAALRVFIDFFKLAESRP